MILFVWQALSWFGFAAVSLWTIADFAARLAGVLLLARLAWRAKDDEDGSQTV